MSCSFWIQRKKKAAKMREAALAAEKQAAAEPVEKAVAEDDAKPVRKPRNRASK